MAPPRRSPRARALARLALALLPAAPLAATGWDPATHVPATIRILRAESPIEVDGRLDERVWTENEPFELRFETRPRVNAEPPVRTLVWIAHDDERIYFAFRALDPEPAKIRARYADRDRGFGDDQIGVILDPFHDGRRAFEFFVTPLGVQSDILEDDVTGGDDPSWDAIWDSAGRLTAEGFEVEGAVPFTSLRYPRPEPGGGEQVWGFNAVRFWERDASHRIALEPRDPNRNCLLCQLAELTGIEGLEPRLDVELDPTLTGSSTDRRGAPGEEELEAGISGRWGVTPNWSLNATINPDFSQVEADARQLDVNQRFALFFEEKRPFFLEGADLFDTELDVVHTRDVADPDWGLKLTGKEGVHAVGLLTSEDRITNLLLPGAQGSALDSLPEESLATLLRYRRDLPLAGSTAGLLVTDRQGPDGYSNRVAGADALLRFGGHHRARIEAFGSETRYPASIVERHGQPAGSFRDHALRLAYGYQSEHWEAEAELEDLGDGFRADLGFVPQVDVRAWSGDLERILRGAGRDTWYDEIRLGGGLDESRDQAGALLGRGGELWWTFQGARQSSFVLVPGWREERFAGRSFEGGYLEADFSIRPAAWIGAGLEARGGDAIDFDGARPARTFAIAPELALRLGRHVQLELEHEHERLDIAAGELYRAGLSRIALLWQLDRRTQVRLISQYLKVDRAPELYPEPVERSEESLTDQLLFSWKLDPQTVVYAGYSDDWRGTDDAGLERASRTFFLKLGYAWLP